MGPEAFAERAAAAGVDAVLTVDLPIDELAELATPLAARDVAVVPLVAPTSTPDRIDRLAQFAPPFVYYISLVGVTGVRAAAPVDPERLAMIRRAAAAPVAVGFGIRTAADARRFAKVADGVVVGSALVDRVASGAAAVGDFVAELATAMRRSLLHARDPRAGPHSHHRSSPTREHALTRGSTIARSSTWHGSWNSRVRRSAQVPYDTSLALSLPRPGRPFIDRVRR